MTPPRDDAPFARWLAAHVGELLLALRAEMGFADPAALKAAGDKRAHDLIMMELGRWRPADAVLSEEGARTDPARLTAERVWIVDPLDGTREFSEEGRADWAVHIGLWGRHAGAGSGGLLGGAIALPAEQRVLGTDTPPPPPPARRNDAAQSAGDTTWSAGRIRIAASRTRPPAFVTALAEALDAELVPMGSAGRKIAAVIDGDVDAYVHAGGQYEWDSAAPVAVATATGLHASRIDGSALQYNQLDPRLPDLLVCREDLALRLLEALAGLLPE